MQSTSSPFVKAPLEERAEKVASATCIYCGSTDHYVKNCPDCQGGTTPASLLVRRIPVTEPAPKVPARPREDPK